MTDAFDRLTAALADRYRIERELGAGGMATVWLAHDLKHDRDVAIKVLHADLGAALGAERFLAEIRTTARLQHPHILPLLDSGAADGLLYYVMPLVTGETLRARLERERQLPIDDAVRIAREVADALSYAHGRAVIHRDIKPENILLQNGHALVADFGIALAVQTASGQRMTQTGLSLGTPQYMSPEQAMGERTIDARSDVYAVGVVTYEMLVGEPPFTGLSVQAIVARLITEEPRGITAQRKAVPEHIEAAVLRALEKLPADRFATAAEYGAALRDGATVIRTPVHRGPASQGGQTRRWSRARIIASCAALVLGGAFLGLGVAHQRPSDVSRDAPLTATSILPPPGGTFGEQRAMALSPDGRRLAFVLAASDGSRMLWVRALDRLDAEQVPHSAGADAPFWSPDGRSIGYFADGYLTVLEQSGETRKLCPVTGPTGGSWSTSGVILFGHRGGLSTVSVTGGACKLIFPRDSGPPLKGLFLPDGKRFLISRGRQLDMIAANLEGKVLATLPVRTLEFAVVAPGYLITASRTDAVALDAQWLNLQSLVLEGPVARVASDVRSQGGIETFTASSTGVLAFLPGGVDRPYLVYDANGLLRDTVHVDGTWSLYVRPSRVGPATVALAGNTVGIWLYDLDANRATRILVHDSTFPTTGYKFGTTFPVFSPDGTHLVYSMVGPGRCRIVDRDLGTNVERVVGREIVSRGSKNECRYPLDWSPDGRSLLVRQDSVLRVVPVDGALDEQVIVRPGRVPEGRFSPDGRSIAYTSEETGRAEVYVQALPSGAPVRVSLDGGRWATWSHGGHRLTFVTPDGRVQVADLARPAVPGVPRTLFSIPTWRRSTFDDNGTGFAIVGDGERYLVRQSATALAVAYLQRWPMLLRHADSSGHPGAP